MQRRNNDKQGRKDKERIIGFSECLPNFIKLGESKNSCINIFFPYRNQQEYLLVMKISGIDIFHFTDEDIYSVCSNFASATMTLRCQYKYIFSSKPVNLSNQKKYITHKMQTTTHPYKKRMLSNKLSELDYAEKHYRERLSYLMLFGDKPEQLEKQALQYIAAMKDTNVELCSRQETIELVASMLTRRDIDIKDETYVYPDKIIVHQNYLEIDNSYTSFLHINSFPAELQDLKLTQIISRLDNVDISMDVYVKPKSEAQREIEKSLDELSTRYIVNRKTAEQQDTDTEAGKLSYIRDRLANGREQMLYVTIRIILTRNTVEALSEAVQDTIKELTDDGISCYIPFNLMREEYFDFLRPSNPVQTPFPLYDTFANQYPFYFQSHLDDDAMLFGTSITGGLIALDFFKRTPRRSSYDIMLAGAKGSGKSVTLKSMIQEQLLLSNKVLCLDLEGEYDDLAKIYDGQIIRMNKNSRINPLQIRTVISSAEDEENNRETNFASEVSRIVTFFFYFNPTLNDFEADVLTSIIMTTLKKKCITPSTDTSVLKAKDFPILADALAEIRQELYAGEGVVNPGLSRNRVDALERLELTMKTLCEGSYSAMFNGITNVSVQENDFIVFNVKDIAIMEQRVYDAQLFNILSIMWQEVCKNTEYNRDIFSLWDRRKIICVIDEAHRFISSDSLQVTSFIETLTRRSRKYEAGILFASQSITDFNPPKTDKEPAGANKVRTIFSLVQYKMILKHSNEKYYALLESFPQFTNSELSSTADFASGEMLVSLGTGRSKFHCLRNVGALDLMYIGNSEDRAAITHDIFNRLYPDDKSFYAAILKQSPANVDAFCEAFSKEIMMQLGNIERSDSEVFYNICYNAAANIANELMSIY